MADVSDRGEDFLSRAKEAEAQAAQSKNPKIKASWLKIAGGYRRLAEQADKQQ
jgi:hypothetical protein